MKKNAGQDNLKGFTLIEIMVASIIAAFIALTAVAALRTVTAGRDKINQNIDAAAEIRYVAALLRKDLANLYRDRNFQNTKFIGLSENTDYGPSTKITGAF